MINEKNEIIDINNVIDVPATEPIEKPQETAIAKSVDKDSSLVAAYIGEQRKIFSLAQTMCQADNIPAAYKNKPADTAIAIDMAARMNVPPLMVMQNLYVVKGKPSWSGQACLSFIRARYEKVKVIYTGTKGTDTRGCYVVAYDKDGDKLEGAEVTIAMAKAEGWINNPKWKNMPEQMLAYRAGAFFARVHCPDALMGCAVEGEAEDIEKPGKRKVEDVL